MRRLVSGVAGSSGRMIGRLFVAAALAGSLPLAVAQHGNFAGGHAGGGYAGHSGGGYGGHIGGGAYGRSFAGYSAPNFVSTFGPHSITGRPGSNFVTGGVRSAPNYASSWGIGHPTWRGENGNWNREGNRDRGRDRDHDRDHFRSGYGYGFAYPFIPVYNSWELLPSDLGYQDYSGYDNSVNQATAAPDEYDSAPPQQDEYRQPYGQPESDYAPPPPPAAAAPATTSSTVLESEPSLTLIFKDGHQQPIRNYALTSDSVIVLDKASAGRQERIPLAELNLPATEQAAQAAGLDFAPPK